MNKHLHVSVPDYGRCLSITLTVLHFTPMVLGHHNTNTRAPVNRADLG